MAVLLNSNVARLVLSYLCEENLEETYLSFCKCSKYLAEERELISTGLKSLSQCSLIEILSDHSRSKFLIDQFIKDLPNASYFQNQSTLIFDKLAFIVESVRPLLQSPPKPQSMRKRTRIDSTEDPNVPKRSKVNSSSYTVIVNPVNSYGILPVGTAEQEEIFPMFSDTLLNNMSLQAEFIENINKYAISSNLNSSLNVDTEKIIQDTVKNPLYDELVEHVILNSTVAQHDFEENENESPESHQLGPSRRKSQPKKMETSTPFPQTDETIKRRLRPRKSKSPESPHPKIIPKSTKKKSISSGKQHTIPPAKKINVISNEKIESPIPQYQQLFILDKENKLGYVTVPITNPINSQPRPIENCSNIVSTDSLQIHPTPQVIVRVDPMPSSLPNPLEDKKPTDDDFNKVNKTPKSTVNNLFNKSKSQSTPRRSHVRVLNFSTLPKVHKSTPKTIHKTQSLNKTLKNFDENSGDEADDDLIAIKKKTILSHLIEEDSSSLDCNVTVIPNTISQTPRSKGNARKCVRVLSRSGSENGGDEGGGESSCKDDEKKDAARIEWETQRRLGTKDFDQHLRLLQQQTTILKAQKKLEKKNETEIEIPEKIYIKYPTPKKIKNKKTPKKKVNKSIKTITKPETIVKPIEIIETVQPIELIVIDPVIKPLENEPLIESVIVPVITESIGFEISPNIEPIPVKLNSCSLNLSSLLETPYKFDPIGFPNTPRFLVPQVQDTPITKIMNHLKVQDSTLKNFDIQTPIFPITPGGANKTPPISPTIGCYNRPTDYSSGSSYYRPDETDNMSGRSVRRDSDRNSDYEDVIAKVKQQSQEKDEESPIKNCRRKDTFFPEPPPEVDAVEIVTSSLDLSNQTFRTPAKEVESDSSSSRSDSSSNNSSSSESESETESTPEKQIVVKPIIEELKNATDFYETRDRQQTELEQKRLRVMKKIIAEPTKPSYMTKKHHILARKTHPPKNTKNPFISPSKRKSTNPGKLIYLEEPPPIRPQRLRKNDKVSKPTASDNSDNAVQSDVLLKEHFTSPTPSNNEDGSSGESLDLIQKHLDSKVIVPVIELDRSHKIGNSDLIAELEGEKEKTDEIQSNVSKEIEPVIDLNEDSDESDESDDFNKWTIHSGEQITLQHDTKFKCSEKQEPLDFTKTNKIMFDEGYFCRISFSQPIDILENAPRVKRQYNRQPVREKVSYSFANKNKKTPNAKFNLKQKERPGTSSNDGEINSVLDLIHGAK